jgi:hypothetical protein
MIPNNQRSERASRQCPLDNHMRPDNALLPFHSALGSDGVIPDSQKMEGICLPGRRDALQQCFASWAAHVSSHPCPRQQSHLLQSRDARNVLLYHITLSDKQRGLSQSQVDLCGEHPDVSLLDKYGYWHTPVQQIHYRFDLALTLLRNGGRDRNGALSRPPRRATPSRERERCQRQKLVSLSEPSAQTALSWGAFFSQWCSHGSCFLAFEW